MDAPFQPEPAHIEWAKTLMGLLKDGNLYGAPSDKLFYRKRGDHLTLVCGNEATVTHQRTIVVFTAAGFVVDVAKEPRTMVEAEMRNKLRTAEVGILDRAGLKDARRLLHNQEEN